MREQTKKEVLTPYIKAEERAWESYALAKKHGKAKETEAKRQAWLIAQASVVAVDEALGAVEALLEGAN